MLGMTERAGVQRVKRLHEHNLPSLHSDLDPTAHAEAMLCSDGDTAVPTFARARGIARHVINARATRLTGPSMRSKIRVAGGKAWR